MNKLLNFLRYSLSLILLLSLIQCDDQDENGFADDPSIALEAPLSDGHAQYKLSVQSGYAVSVPLTVNSGKKLQRIEVSKTVNLQADQTFGESGTLTIVNAPSVTPFEYTFNYSPSADDVDKLVGFTFTAETEDGFSSQADLTLVVTLSPRDNLTRRRWNLKSILHVNNPDHPNMEVINDCEKDNAMLLYEDHTMEIDYGSDTGNGGCMFDGFNIYDSWRLTDDDKLFIRVSHGIFSPDVSVTDTFVVRVLSIDRFSIEQTVDLSDFGGAKDEKFLYIYQAGPK